MAKKKTSEVSTRDYEYDLNIDNPKDLAIKISIGIASIALIGGVVTSIILNSKKKKNK